MAKFTHLHVHTQYSLLDGLNKTASLFKKVSESGMDSVAITDHGVLYGVPEFWKMSKDFNIKPILGCEIYLSPSAHSIKKEVEGIRYYHLLLLAKNLTGYQNLSKLVTLSHIEGFYYKPRVDIETIAKYSEGLICTSACLAGPLSRHIIKDELPKARDWLIKLKSIFKENFYLEIQRNGITCCDKVDSKAINSLKKHNDDSLLPPLSPDEMEDYLNTINLQIKVNKQIYKFADEFKIPVIATTDAHYLNEEDREIQKILFCIRDGKKLDERTSLNGYLETYIQTPETLMEKFSDMPEVLEETLKIAEKIEPIKLKPDRVQPQFWNTPKGSTAKLELELQTKIGALWQYKRLKLENKSLLEKELATLDEKITKQIDYELMVIDKMGYNDYFLIVGDLIGFARKEGIVVGVRGSAAGSLVAYCLGITNIDPLAWGLVFERFLNLERASPPDIDMDIQDDRREELINYARNKYGHTSVAGIITFGRMATKAAIRDVARVMGIDLRIADVLSKKVIVLFGKPYSFDKMMAEDPSFKQMVEESPDLTKLGKIVKKIENLSRHMGVHAAGYLITPGPIDQYMAYQKDAKNPDLLVTQMDGNWIDKLDFMKFDFLGLRTLTIINNTLLQIKKNKGIDIKLDDINLNPTGSIEEFDAKALEVFRTGNTVGVFQFESPAMIKYLKELKPRDIADLSFLCAAYRPGPMGYIKEYIEIRNGKKTAQYTIPELEPILESTLGFPIYQEQLLEICMKLGGFTLGEGDVIRNALKKKQLDLLKVKETDFKEYFLKNYPYSAEIGDKIWNQLEPFASYGFNKAHSASYAVVAYWCAFLKGNFPIEFTIALLHTDIENLDRTSINVSDAKKAGFSILPPSINKSDIDFTAESADSIRFGLGAIKSTSIKAIEALVAERKANGEYTSFDDLVARVGHSTLTKKTSECLIKCGAMDMFGDRNQLLEILLEVYHKASKKKEVEEAGLISLFELDEKNEKVIATKFPALVDMATDKEKLEWEKELLGVYVSRHPLDPFRWISLKKEFYFTPEIQNLKKDKIVKLVGHIIGFRILLTKKDAKKMAILKIEDLEDQIEGVVFPSVYDKLSELGLISEGRAFLITAKVNENGGEEKTLIIDNLEPANQIPVPKKFEISIIGINDQNLLNDLKSIFTEDGETLIISYGSTSSQKKLEKKFDIKDLRSLNILHQIIALS